jgi:hypothetical protein
MASYQKKGKTLRHKNDEKYDDDLSMPLSCSAAVHFFKNRTFQSITAQSTVTQRLLQTI